MLDQNPKHPPARRLAHPTGWRKQTGGKKAAYAMVLRGWRAKKRAKSGKPGKTLIFCVHRIFFMAVGWLTVACAVMWMSYACSSIFS